MGGIRDFKDSEYDRKLAEYKELKRKQREAQASGNQQEN